MQKSAGAPAKDKRPSGWAAKSVELARNLTLLHGDFHKGNIMYRPYGSVGTALSQGEIWRGLPYGHAEQDDHEIVLIDFQSFGLGNPAWELVYFVSKNDEFCIKKRGIVYQT